MSSFARWFCPPFLIGIMGVVPWNWESPFKSKIYSPRWFTPKKKKKSKGAKQASFISHCSTMWPCCCRFSRHHSGSSVDIIDYCGKQTEVKGHVPLGSL